MKIRPFLVYLKMFFYLAVLSKITAQLRQFIAEEL